MLILTDTDRLRCDLNQLCKRILQTSCDRSRASLSYIEIRELFRCQLTCRIYRRTCLICDHILYLLRNLFEKFYNDLFRFSGCSSVSKRNQRYIIFFDQFFQGFFCRTYLCIICRCSRINNCCIKNLSCLIYNCQLTACTERRVPSKHHFADNWRLHQKLFQILAKYMNCSVLCLFSQVTSDLTLNCRRDQTFITVLYNFTENRLCDRIISGDHLFLKPSHCLVFRCTDLDSEHFFFFTTVQRKHTMSCKFFDWFFKFIVHLINRRFLRIFCCRYYSSFVHGKFTEIDTVIRFIRNMLCKDIFCAIYRIFYRFHTFFFG